MKNKFTLFIVFLIFVFSGCAHTAVNAVADEGGYFHEEVLSNGLKVFAIKEPNAPLSVFQIWYNAGSINEQIGKTGLSHLLEHMMFKGTPRYGPNTFSRMIKRAGGIDNAGTTKDFVFYYQKLAPDRLDLSIELEADRMRNLIMDPEETLSERDVVMEERRMRYEDDPQSLVYEEVVATAFKNHPYRWPVIGWMTDLKTITRDDLMDYYRIRYVPDNAMIVVAGDIDINSIMAKIKKAFGDISRGPEIERLNVGEPEQRGEKRLYVKKEAELPYVLSAYKAPNILQDDSYALEVLASVLSGGKSTRIYRNLIDKQQIALSAGAGYSSIKKYPYLFYLHGTALPGKKIEDVEAALYEEVEKIKKTPPAEREVQKAKNQIEAEFIMNQDSIFYQAMIVAQFELIGDWRLKDKYLEGIGKVTPGDVQRVAKKYLVEDQRTVGILVPIQNLKLKTQN
ncbi:MAG TPA: insulinase family protein [Nitrospirae bacterium]|nr:insulinase family protein [Nitrospirota bacterium]